MAIAQTCLQSIKLTLIAETIMKLLLRLVLCVTVIIQVSSYTSGGHWALAADTIPDDRITRHEPQSRISELKDLPKAGGGSWLWGILGVVIIAGGAAALAGGGGGGDGGDDDDDSTGSVGGSW